MQFTGHSVPPGTFSLSLLHHRLIRYNLLRRELIFYFISKIASLYLYLRPGSLISSGGHSVEGSYKSSSVAMILLSNTCAIRPLLCFWSTFILLGQLALSLGRKRMVLIPLPCSNRHLSRLLEHNLLSC